MKIARVGALAGSLFLLPHLGIAEEPLWRSAQPEWTSAKSFSWTPASRENRALRGGMPTNADGQMDEKPSREMLPMPTLIVAEPQDQAERTSNGPRQKASPKLESRTKPASFIVEPQAPAIIEWSSSHKQPPERLKFVPPTREKILPPEMLSHPSSKISPSETRGSARASLGEPVVVPPESPSAASRTGKTSRNDESFLDLVTPYTPRFSISGEYLAWWMRSDRIPVLATTGPIPGIGIIGRNGTQNLLGPGAIDQGERDGARFRANIWLDDCRTWGIDGSFFFLDQSTFRFGVNSNTDPVISRPVFILSERREDVETIAIPGFSTGQLRVDSTSRFWGAEGNILKRLCLTSDSSFDVFVGYRYLNLSENVRIREFITAGPRAPDPVGTRVFVADRFYTQNQFNGGQIGAKYERGFGRFFFNARGSLGLGVTNQFVDVDGSQVRIRPGQAAEAFAGGLLAARSNIGHYNRDRFGFVPELGVNVGYQLTPNLRVFVGYNFLWWNSVLRPGEQIDRGVDLNNIPNSRPSPAFPQPRPTVLFHESSLWVQGGSVGLQWSW